MDFQSCWNSVSCLEGWDRVLRLTSVVAGAIVMLGGASSYLVIKQITSLKAPRTLSAKQTEMLVTALKSKPKMAFRVISWADSEESAFFGGQLGKVLKEAGWESKGMVRYYMDEGESPYIGVSVMVDGVNHELSETGRALVDALRASGVQEVQFLPTHLHASEAEWIVIQVGRKPNM